MKVVYTKDNCPACLNLKSKLTQSGEQFQEVKIGRDISREEFIDTFPGVRTVPHVVELP